MVNLMDQCKRNAWSAWSLLRERGYHLDVFLYLLATCLTPACKALGRCDHSCWSSFMPESTSCTEFY